MNADDIFYKEYKGNMNFMTRTLVRRGMINPRFAYEISSGRGIYHEPIFGITILGLTSKNKIFRAYKLNKLVESQRIADEYVKELRSIMKRTYETVYMSSV
jgi:hypothetical protein